MIILRAQDNLYELAITFIYFQYLTFYSGPFNYVFHSCAIALAAIRLYAKIKTNESYSTTGVYFGISRSHGHQT